LSLVLYNIDSEDDFKDFVLNKLIESSSLDDEDNSYFDATNILAHESLNEPLHRGLSLDTNLWIMKDSHGITYYIEIISQITLYLV
jgi:hypothetical protein